MPIHELLTYIVTGVDLLTIVALLTLGYMVRRDIRTLRKLYSVMMDALIARHVVELSDESLAALAKAIANAGGQAPAGKGPSQAENQPAGS